MPKLPNRKQTDELLDFAEGVARRAGAKVRELRQRELVVDRREHHDIKLEADRASETIVMGAIGDSFPGHAILSEEAGVSGPRDAEFIWVIDPLDGTANFARALPHFCVSIGCVCGDALCAGVIYDPMREEIYRAAPGRPAERNGSPIRASETKRLDEALILVGFGNVTAHLSRDMAIWHEVIFRASKGRSTGSAALDMGFVAGARADAYFECGINAWDVAAGTVILESAGGCVRLLHLEGVRFDILASNAPLHPELEKILDKVNPDSAGASVAGIIRKILNGEIAWDA
ncbi:MAG TPA: inositol monophosphatase family protein [Candidatus Brocadiia bacterium]|nr:inositol monophosphatase family protein [Candidatus Brocadiia bacterium]